VAKIRIDRIVRAGVVAFAFAAAAIFVVRSLDQRREADEGGDQPLSAPVRVKVIDGRARVIVTSGDMAASGIEVALLNATTYQEQVRGLGTVIAPQALAAQADTYQSAVAEATRAELAVKAARLEVQRLAPLHQADRIVSDKALETAQDDLTVKEAKARAATASLATQRFAFEGQWGPVLVKWLADGAPALERLLAGQDLLVRIALPAGSLASDPTVAHVQAAPGVMVDARIISGAPQADPTFQGQGFYAVVAENARLRPGMTVPAAVTAAAPVAGVLVPESAIVRWRGMPWVFVESAQGEFVRQPISAGIATPRGWLVTSGLSAGVPIVAHGAQLLLSEEAKAQAAAGDRK